ncbi:FAD binding domain-containing protein [Coniochaeta ligniaria NRRL 30616]|uniref:FAD binding domain-containing protein n=1 Tax=Coniochaeta ligniaria NRRL 30616 TaxID=1408157 RepID=A0A1J7IBB5_9PEZI|nr:FAD binding domain-containing protein [Coniochaeta ligniaria NRRL 30616]
MRSISSCLFLLAFVLGSSASPGSAYDCRPGQPCWPSIQEWQHFNESIAGHLYETVPIAAPCYKNSPYYNETACQIVQGYYGNSTARGTHFGQTYWLNWETSSSSGCALSKHDPTQTLYGTCSLGRLASYYVDVRDPFHISSTLKFAKAHNIRISIKNTGHDFFGRSSAPNTLAIWTHNLETMDFYPNFTAHNCPSANAQNVGELAAGVIAGDAYRFFSSHGMDITGGYEQSVGLAGGFAQGGGVGSFTTTYGLMADNAVEFEVVTADGQLRIVNECNDPDLFWAMRGGGGGTFGVLTKYRVQLHPSVPIHVYTFTANCTGADLQSVATKNVALREIMTAHAQHQPAWSQQLVTGQVEYFPNRVSVSLVLPYADDGSKLKSATASFAQFLNNRTDLSVGESGYTSYANYATYLDVTAADARVTEPAGIFSQLASRLIPRKVFASPEGIDALVSGVLQGIATSRSLLNLTGTQVVLETPVSNPDRNQTASAHPAWRDSLWHVIHVGEWYTPLEAGHAQAVAAEFLKMLDPLKELSPGGGAYLNEAHWGEPDWQATYFGAFYGRLLEVKNRYDPTHVFDCWKCVGWRGEEE